jgi:hypothetical protein
LLIHHASLSETTRSFTGLRLVINVAALQQEAATRRVAWSRVLVSLRDFSELVAWCSAEASTRLKRA